MSTSLFSTYRAGENRVTASIIAVLRSITFSRAERLLGALMERSEFELVRFRNQPSRGAEGVPDAEIVGSCRLLLETKTARRAVRADQLGRHLTRLDGAQEDFVCLILLTPDDVQPPVVDDVGDPRLVWASFAALDQAIDELLQDKMEVVSEREAFLLRELQLMLVAEHLVASAKDTVVVPARHAWQEYQRFSAYICQPNRAFQDVRFVAFYSGGQIHPLVPTIEETHEAVVFENGRYTGRLGQLVEHVLHDDARSHGELEKVFLLSSPDDPRTVRLNAPIVNDLISETGKTVAFTQNQRYVRLEDLVKARATSELARG